jgi:hypothetical protein
MSPAGLAIGYLDGLLPVEPGFCFEKDGLVLLDLASSGGSFSRGEECKVCDCLPYIARLPLLPNCDVPLRLTRVILVTEFVSAPEGLYGYVSVPRVLHAVGARLWVLCPRNITDADRMHW